MTAVDPAPRRPRGGAPEDGGAHGTGDAGRPRSRRPAARARRAPLGLSMLAVLSLSAAAPAAASWDVGDTEQPGQWTIYNRSADGGALGLPVAAGDFNGDGRSDVILTPVNADSGPDKSRRRAGEAIIVFSAGRVTGELDLAALDVNALPEAVTIIYAADPLDFLGTGVVGADLDGDGYDDAIIGAQHGDGKSNGRPDSGEAVIVWGGPSLGGRVIDLNALGPDDEVTLIYGADAGDRLGVWVGAGDFDGDGTADALLGADQGSGPENSRPHAGETYVVYGGGLLRATNEVDLLAPPMAITRVFGVDPEDHSGSTVRGADLNGDGAAEILIGAGLNRLSAAIDGQGGGTGHGFAGGDGPGNQRANAGEAYVVYGEAAERPSVIDLAAAPASTVFVYGVDPGDVYGEELSAGDFDGDGHGDLAVGALAADGPDNRRGNAGELALIGGGPSLRGSVIDLAAPPPNVMFVHGAGPRHITGDTIMLVDLDRDGTDDLVIGSPRASPAGRLEAGTVSVIFGTTAARPPSVDLAAPPAAFSPFAIDGRSADDMIAYSASFGDVDGDGFADLVFNAMAGDGFEDRLPDAGEVYVLAGARLVEVARRPTPGPTPSPTPEPPAPCAGDCDGNGAVTIDELVRAVGIGLGQAALDDCRAADVNGDQVVTVNELIRAVLVALDGCEP